MNRSRAQEAVSASALVTGGIYLYRRLIEPPADTTQSTPQHGSSQQPQPPQTEFAAIQREQAVLRAPSQPHGPLTIPAQVFLGSGPVADTPRFIVGWGFTYLVLALWAQASGAAGSFALLVALGSVLGNGRKVSADIRAQLENQRAQKSAGVAPPPQAVPTVAVDYTGGSLGTAAPRPRGPRPNTHTGNPRHVPSNVV